MHLNSDGFDKNQNIIKAINLVDKATLLDFYEKHFIEKTSNPLIIYSLGNSKEMLKKMVIRGVNVCRINFSHSTHDQAKEIINNIKEVNKELQLHIAILADLQGPKIRVGTFEKPKKLRILHTSRPGSLPGPPRTLPTPL